MEKLKQTIVSLAVENCELRQSLKDAESLKDLYCNLWHEESNKNMTKAVEREG